MAPKAHQMPQHRVQKNLLAYKKLPSRLHLAYALAVVQSKPRELTIKGKSDPIPFPKLELVDYILGLRQHMQTKYDYEEKSGPQRCLDSASYWARKFHEADAGRAQLESKVTDCEREIERLKSDICSMQNITSTGKRSDDAICTPAAERRNVQHVSSDGNIEDVLPEDEETLRSVHQGKKDHPLALASSATGSNEHPAEGTKLSQHLYHAHKHYRGQHCIDHRQLSYHLEQAADCVAPLLISACLRHRHHTSRAHLKFKASNDAGVMSGPVMATYDDELITTFEATARVFMSITVGLQKLDGEGFGKKGGKSDTSPTAEYRGAVVHSIINMFGRVLERLSSTASAQAAHEAAHALAAATEASERGGMKTRSRNRTYNSRRKPNGMVGAAAAASKQQGAEIEDDGLAMRLLTNFLVNVLTTAGTGCGSGELVEGLLFVLFQRLGDCVFRCAFGHGRCADVGDDIDAWVDAEAGKDVDKGRLEVGSEEMDEMMREETVDEEEEEDESESSRQRRRKQKHVGQRALAIELPSLVTLLERGLAVAQRHIAPLTSTSAAARTATARPFPAAKSSGGSGGSRPSTEALRAGLSLLARKKLERTLARAIFGGGWEDGEEGGLDEMSECLTMPVRQALLAQDAVGRCGRKGETKTKTAKAGGGDSQDAEEDVRRWFVEKVWSLVGWQAVLEMK